MQVVPEAVSVPVSPMIHYDKNGDPVDDLLVWAGLFEDMEYRRVGSTEVGDYWVSTIWLGIDHNWGFGGDPLIFETMVFIRDGEYQDEYMDRYSTEAQAFDGHLNVVGMLAATEGVEPRTVTEPSWMERLRDEETVSSPQAPQSEPEPRAAPAEDE